MTKNITLATTLSSPQSNLPSQVGFFGRRSELKQIEKALIQDGIRRLTITGIGGQGKTYLAIKAGQNLLHKSRLFKKVCFVDYTVFSGLDAVAFTINILEKVLDVSRTHNLLDDIEAANKALAVTPTLLILDHVETIPNESLLELLEVAKQWSELGDCRLILTSRIIDFEHSAYPTDNNLIHQLLPLSGLAEKDALAYFMQFLLKSSPAPQISKIKSDDLLRVFKQVNFQPLLISVLAIPLKLHPFGHTEARLKTLLAQTPDNPLWAVLNLALENLELELEKTGWLANLARRFQRNPTEKLKITADTLRLLPRLGVFQGGGFEPDLLKITQIPNKQWQLLGTALEMADLIHQEFLPNFKVPYLKYHPSLAPALWTRLTPEEQNQELAVHRQRYAQLISYMFYEEKKNADQAHNLVKQDLPNLFYAIYNALEAGDKWAVSIANYFDLFLNIFGLKRDSAALKQRIEQAKKK